MLFVNTSIVLLLWMRILLTIRNERLAKFILKEVASIQAVIVGSLTQEVNRLRAVSPNILSFKEHLPNKCHCGHVTLLSTIEYLVDSFFCHIARYAFWGLCNDIV